LPEEKHVRNKRGKYEQKAAETTGSHEHELAPTDKVYNYLVERKNASLLQMARDLNLEVLAIMKILMELKKQDKVEIVG